MENTNQPTFAHGKICYLEIPAADVTVSSEFYKNVFEWKIRNDNAGNISFDDGVGQVSGMWVAVPKPSTEIGIVVSIMVDDMDEAMNEVEKYGGKIIQRPNDYGHEKIARFTDPFGNVFGLYEG